MRPRIHKTLFRIAFEGYTRAHTGSHRMQPISLQCDYNHTVRILYTSSSAAHLGSIAHIPSKGMTQFECPRVLELSRSFKATHACSELQHFQSYGGNLEDEVGQILLSYTAAFYLVINSYCVHCKTLLKFAGILKLELHCATVPRN